MSTDIGELQKLVEKLQAEILTMRKDHKAVLEENLALKQQLGIRKFLVSTTPAPMETRLDENSGTRSDAAASVKPKRKPPPFFIQGVKSLKVFNKFLETVSIVPAEFKSLTSGELKLVANNSEDYRALRRALEAVVASPDAEKQELGYLAITRIGTQMTNHLLCSYVAYTSRLIWRKSSANSPSLDMKYSMLSMCR